MYRVELKVKWQTDWLLAGFLMYRVELKGLFLCKTICVLHVPNVPCGVESIVRQYNHQPPSSFLMYRVELKDASSTMSTLS